MFNVKKLLEASKALGEAKNINPEVIKEITIEALEKAYIRILNGGIKTENIDLPDPRVKVVLDVKKGNVDFYQIKTVKEDVEDDMLEIDLEDAVDYKKDVKFGDDIEIHDEDIDIEELSKNFIKQFKGVFHQRLNDAEKTVLYETYKDRIGEIVIGEVEKVEERGVQVKIGDNSVYLSRKDMIGDEKFMLGQQIKLYIADVSTDKKGSIAVTRSDPGFVKRLFEEEIHEIYDGTIIIKNIARRAGKRSKVAVYSNDHDVDATGSCIGKDGSRINKIVNQLGGNGMDKEKIDIVAYSDDPALYIIDALRPAEVVGINIDQNDEEGKEATCIVKDGQYSKAIGLKGINIRLAVKLTGFDLTILEEAEALKEGLKYTSTEELKAKEAARLEEIKKNEFAKQSLAYKAEKQKEEELKKVEANAQASREEAKAKKETAKVSKAKEDKPRASSLEEELAKAKAAATRAENREAEHVEIKTTTNILDLEKQLEAEKQDAKKEEKKVSRKPRKITEEEVPNEVKKDENKEEVKKMDIYTEEELRQLEEEENENDVDNYDDDEDINYEDYDEYYDDEK